MADAAICSFVLGAAGDNFRWQTRNANIEVPSTFAFGGESPAGVERDLGRTGIESRKRCEMRYKKITVELVVDADEADVVVGQLNGALDQLEERHTIFGGDIEAVSFKHAGKRRKSALAHTLAAGETIAVALRSTSKHLGNAVRAVI